MYYFLTVRRNKDNADNRNHIIYHGLEKDMPEWSSKMGGFKSEYELRKAVNIHKENCKTCGGLIELSYGDAQNARFKQNQICFNCNYWEIIEASAKVDKRRVIIKGTSYYVGDDVRDKGFDFAGFGGRQFRLKRFDSDEVVFTRNLWCQGEIPNVFLERIPNNAEFV